MENPQQKPSKLKIFQLVHKNFANIGISPDLAEQPYPFNGKIIMGSATLLLYVICSLMYLFDEAKTFTENTRTIYMCSLAAVIFFDLMILILNAKELFQLMNECVSIVNTRECTAKNPNTFFSNPSF